MKIFYIDIDENTGIEAMSLVHDPAVEEMFMAFGKQEPIELQFDEEHHIVRGVAMRCDFPIYRRDNIDGEYYVVFKKDAIERIAQKFMKEQKGNVVNIEHDANRKVDGVFLFESFLIDRKNGINPEKFSNIEDGSWIVSYKVENEEVWDEIKKTKSLRGFSIEGMFYCIEQAQDFDEWIDDLINK